MKGLCSSVIPNYNILSEISLNILIQHKNPIHGGHQCDLFETLIISVISLDTNNPLTSFI